MNHPDTTTTDPYAYSLWPDAWAASEEEMMAWGPAAGYAQPGLTVEDFTLEDLDSALAAWGQSGATAAELCGFVIECRLDARRDGSPRHVQSWRSPPEHRRAGFYNARADHHPFPHRRSGSIRSRTYLHTIGKHSIASFILLLILHHRTFRPLSLVQSPHR